MPMMQIAVMGMSVNQWGVAMRLAGWIGRGVRMLMVGIVTMPVLVLHCIMAVLMIVPLCQVQPQSEAHQAASD